MVLFLIGAETTPETVSQNLEKILIQFDSPLNARQMVKLCLSNSIDLGECRLSVAIMGAESKFCTAFAKPEIERDYHNCSGWKSQEILSTHKADTQGSWLKKFNSYEEYFNEYFSRMKLGYYDKNCSTAQCVMPYYVGRQSDGWTKNVNYYLSLF